MKDWIPVISAMLGFIAGISGTWLTQRATRQLEADRWKREQAKGAQQEVKQIHLDVVEYAENQLAWLESADLLVDSFDPAQLSLHRHQLGGRVKTFAQRPVVVGWEMFRQRLEEVSMEFRLGNLHESPEFPGRADLDDQSLIPQAVVAGEILILIVRAQYEQSAMQQRLTELSQTLRGGLRYRQALDEWIAEAARDTSPMHEIYRAT